MPARHRERYSSSIRKLSTITPAPCPPLSRIGVHDTLESLSVISRNNQFGRGKGSKATKTAAYSAGERIRDERTGLAYDCTDRTDVAHADIVPPTQYAGRVDMECALDRSTLWNAAEHAGRRWNSRLAREILVHVPPKLTPAQPSRRFK
jgi:hypothetical protein